MPEHEQTQQRREPTAERPTYGEILAALAPQMPKGRPGDPEPVEPTPEELLANADDLSSLDAISPDDRKLPTWHATLRLRTEWVIAYGRWIEENRPDLLSDAPTLHAVLRQGPDGRAGRFARYNCAGLARDVRLIAARWEAGVRSPAMSLERLATAFGMDPRTFKRLAADREWDLRPEGKQRWTVSYARMAPADISRIDEAFRSKTTRRSKRPK